MKRLIVRGVAAVVTAGTLAGCGVKDDGTVPLFEVDALWPQPLEYPTILGPVSGVTVAPDGNILIVTRQDGFNATNEINSVTGTGECCTPSKAVLEFTPDGALVRQWGGPDEGYAWPARPHGIGIDPEGNVWIGGGWFMPAPAGGRGGRGARGADPNAPPPPPPTPVYDTQIHKFSRTGEHIATIGEAAATPSSTSQNSFGGPADFAFDADANEVYVADGYANHRVVVLDASTGAFKRSWGAYGNEPDDAPQGPYDPAAAPSQQFRTVTCAELSNDGLVYVCDQGNDRIQVFERDGTFVQEMVVKGATLGTGTVRDIAFSTDEDQRWIYVTDQMNERVHILFRSTLEVKTSFGIGGRYPGNFRELGGIAVDAAGNIFTAEDGQGRKIQKFRNIGIGPVPSLEQGPLYPQAMGGM